MSTTNGGSGASPGYVDRLGPRTACWKASCTVPGDKSLSHRAALFGALAAGTTRIHNFLARHRLRGHAGRAARPGRDRRAPRADRGHGATAPARLREPEAPLDCGGSGTTMRLLAGILAGQPFYSVLTGNAQLARRPMDRIAAPVAADGRDGAGPGRGAPGPAHDPGRRSARHRTTPPRCPAPRSSRRCCWRACSPTAAPVVREPAPSRDHTERMLLAMGAPVRRLSPVAVEIGPGPLAP